jgi:hypothetical protein
MSLSEESFDHRESDEACAPSLDKVDAQCPRGQGTLKDGGEPVGGSLSSPSLDRGDEWRRPRWHYRSWRPRTPQIALRALEKGVPFDSLNLRFPEPPLLRLMIGEGNWKDVSSLLESVTYRNSKYGIEDHALALAQAVTALSGELDVQPLGPQGTNSKGRPRKVEPYRPAELAWDRVLRWHLPWLFRKELDKAEEAPEPALSLDAPMGEDVTLYDLLDDEESSLGFRAMHERSRSAQRREAGETLFHRHPWSVWHGKSDELKEALGLKHETAVSTFTLEGERTPARKLTRRVSPPLRSDALRDLRKDVRRLGASVPVETLGREPSEDGHADNKRSSRSGEPKERKTSL